MIIVAPDGKEYKAHMLLLAYHSEFFQRAFTSSFREKEVRAAATQVAPATAQGAAAVIVEAYRPASQGQCRQGFGCFVAGLLLFDGL